MKVINQTKEIVIAPSCATADTPFSRMKGLLGRAHLREDEALLITRCNSIHMLFMKFSIDAIFVDKKDIVVGLLEGIKPWQISKIFLKSSYVIELCPGVISKTKTMPGDKLYFQE